MFFPFTLPTLFESNFLLFLVDVTPGLLVLTTIIVVALIEIVYSDSAPTSGSAAGGQNPLGGGPEKSPTPENSGDDGWDWKKKLLVGLGITLGTLMLGSYCGWSDPFYFVKHPVVFGGAVVDRVGTLIPGLTFGPEEVRPFLVEKFPEVWAKTNSMDEFLRKTLEAEVNPWNLAKITRRLNELGLHPEPIFRAVEAAYPQGASGATLEHALQVAANDFIDTAILEHAENYWE